MKTAKQQQGMTAIGWVLVFALIAITTLFVLKLFPIYIDGYKVSSVLSNLEEERSTRSMTPAEITSTILKRLDINMVGDVTKDNIFIERAGNVMNIDVEYEVRSHLFGNLDVVVSFNKRAEVPFR